VRGINTKLNISQRMVATRFSGDRLQNGSNYAIGPLSVCLSCSVGVLWPNGWMDQDATWYGGRPRPRRYCVRWEPSSHCVR